MTRRSAAWCPTREGSGTSVPAGNMVFASWPEAASIRWSTTLRQLEAGAWRRSLERIPGEIEQGFDDTGIKAGLIGEIGLSWPVHRNGRQGFAGGRSGATPERCLGEHSPGTKRTGPLRGAARRFRGGRRPRTDRCVPRRPHPLRRGFHDPSGRDRVLSGIRPLRPGVELLSPGPDRHAERCDADQLHPATDRCRIPGGSWCPRTSAQNTA